jgi:hypothetical protein
MKLCSKVEEEGEEEETEEGEEEEVPNPLVLIMTPFLITILHIYSWDDLCDFFLDYPVHCRFLAAPCLGRKPRLDLIFTEEETDRDNGVLILVLESGHHPVVSVPLSNFRPPVVVEQCQQKILLGLLERLTFHPSHTFTRPSFFDNRHICRCWKEFDSLGEEQVLVVLPPELVSHSPVQCSNLQPNAPGLVQDPPLVARQLSFSYSRGWPIPQDIPARVHAIT